MSKESVREDLEQARRELDQMHSILRRLHACWLRPRDTDLNELWAEIEEECSWLSEDQR